MVEKWNTWGWAQDGRICQEFDKLNLIEISVLICGIAIMPFLEIIGFIFGFNHDPSDMIWELENFFWWAGITIIIVRTSVFKAETHWPPKWHQRIEEVDLRIYLFLFVIVFVYAIVILWPGTINILLANANSFIGDKKIYFLKIWNGFLSVVFQELEYRVVLYYSLNRVLGRHAAFWACSLFFGFLHEASVFYRMATSAGGAIFSILTIATGSAIPAIILHSAVNISALFLAIALK